MINPLHPVALSVYIASIDISNLYFHKDISPRSMKNWGRIGTGISQIEHLPQAQPHYSAPPRITSIRYLFACFHYGAMFLPSSVNCCKLMITNKFSQLHILLEKAKSVRLPDMSFMLVASRV